MNKTIEWQQKVSDKVLKRIHECLDYNAILAGGAPRDWYHGREARDLDIYINGSAFKSDWKGKGECGRKLLCKVFNTDKITKLFDLGAYAPENVLEQDKIDRVLCIYEAAYKGLPIQFIVVENTFSMLNQFALSLSKFWYHPNKPTIQSINGKHELSFIHKDFNTQELNLYNAGKVIVYDSSLRGEAYLEKIKAKYPEFEYITKPNISKYDNRFEIKADF